jgi:hypothetical protein
MSRTPPGHPPDGDPGRRNPVLILLPCPACGFPAEVTDRFALNSTDGPVAHLALRCVAGHPFKMPVDMLPAPSQQQLRAQEHTPAPTGPPITSRKPSSAMSSAPTTPRAPTVEQRLAEIIRAFSADALSSTVNLNVDLDIMLAVLAQALLAALRARLPGYAAVTPTSSSAASSGPPATSPPPAMASPSGSNDAPAHPSCARPASPQAPAYPGWATGRAIHYEFS